MGIHTLKNLPLYIVVCHLIPETSQDESRTTDISNVLMIFSMCTLLWVSRITPLNFLKQFASNEG